MASRIVESYDDSLVDILYEAIPQEEEDRLINLPSGYMENGGTCRGWRDRDAAVCTYNNTIKSEADIVAWYQRAYVLAGQRFNELLRTEEEKEEVML